MMDPFIIPVDNLSLKTLEEAKTAIYGFIWLNNEQKAALKQQAASAKLTSEHEGFQALEELKFLLIHPFMSKLLMDTSKWGFKVKSIFFSSLQRWKGK